MEDSNKQKCCKEPDIQVLPNRVWRLVVTGLGLTILALGVVTLLLTIGAAQSQPLTVFAIPIYPDWALASLGGLLGGLARALYAFLFDNYAFLFRCNTGRSSPYVIRISQTTDIEDDYDPLYSWYLYFVKPFIGLTLGLLFALAIDLGLLSLTGQTDGQSNHPLRLVATAGLAGLFAESAWHRLQHVMESGKPRDKSNAA